MPWTTNLSQQRCMVNLIYNPFTPFLASSFCPPTLQLLIFDCPLAGSMGGHVTGSGTIFRPWSLWKSACTLNSLGDSAYAVLYIQTSCDLTVPSVVTWDISFSDPRDVFISVKLGQAKSSSCVIIIMGALESDEANPSCLLLLLGWFVLKWHHVDSHPIGQSLNRLVDKAENVSNSFPKL